MLEYLLIGLCIVFLSATVVLLILGMIALLWEATK